MEKVPWFSLFFPDFPQILLFPPDFPWLYEPCKLYIFQSYFLVQLQNSKGYDIVAQNGGQFLLFKDAG